MSTPNFHEVQSNLERLSTAMVAAVRGGWRAWRESDQAPRWRCKRSRANFVWEEIIDRAHQDIASEPGVVVVKSQETFSFIVDDAVLFRFKKADEEGLSANYPTPLALAFHDHERDLFGRPELQRVEVVYLLNRLETDIIDVLVVAREADRVVWAYSLLDRGEGVIPLPMPEPAAPSNPGSRVVRPRGSTGEADRQRSSE